MGPEADRDARPPDLGVGACEYGRSNGDRRAQADESDVRAHGASATEGRVDGGLGHGVPCPSEDEAGHALPRAVCGGEDDVGRDQRAAAGAADVIHLDRADLRETLGARSTTNRVGRLGDFVRGAACAETDRAGDDGEAHLTAPGRASS